MMRMLMSAPSDLDYYGDLDNPVATPLPKRDYLAELKAELTAQPRKPARTEGALERLKCGDVLLYTDADTYPISDLTPVFEYTREHGVLLFEEQGCLNKVWTKRDCFLQMHCDVPANHERIMACGRFQAFKHPEPPFSGSFDTFVFLDQWNRLSVDPRCQLWDRSIMAPDRRSDRGNRAVHRRVDG
jgi:hypothetical protein